MKKLLLLFMLALLPLQASWGVVGLYCQSGQPVCSTPCDSEGQQASDDITTSAITTSADGNAFDEGGVKHNVHSCHVYCAPFISVQHANTPQIPSDIAHQFLEMRHFSGTLGERPERPQWSNVA